MLHLTVLDRKGTAMPMTHAEKVDAMHRHMGALGISTYTAAPPAWRLLWRLGVQAPPPLFLGFWTTAIAMGSFFGFFWGLFMWLFAWPTQMPAWAMVSTAGGAGVFFGLA